MGRDALLIFFMSLAHGGVYGLLPGNLRRFGALVCPLFGLTEAALQDRIDLLVKHEFYHTYEVDEKPFIWIRNYHHFQSARWDRVGKPEQPLPDEWVIPDDLARHIAKQAVDQKDGKHPEEWGLREVHLRGLTCWPEVSARWHMATPSPPQDTPGNSRQLPESPDNSGLDVDVDADVDADIDRDDNDSPRGRAGGNGDLPRSEDYPPRPKRLGETGDLPILKTEFGNLWAACKGLPWAEVRERWLQDVAAAVKSPGDTWLTSDKQAADLLVEYAPKGDEKYLPSKWLSRVEEIVAPKPRKGSVSEYAQKRSVAGPKPGVSGTGWDLLDKILEEE